MRGTNHCLTALAYCLLATSLVGCAATAESAGGLLGKMAGKKSAEEALDIKTPEDRANELRELAARAHEKSPEEQTRITAELAAEIRDEEDPVMRRHLLRTLAQFRTPMSMSIMQAGLQDGDMEVRRAACLSLGNHGGPEAAQALSHVVGADTSVDVRIAAVRALGETRDKSAVAPLADLLTDPDPAIQYRAQESLRKVSGRDYGGNVQAWREYAKTGESSAAEVSFAERMRRAIF